MNGSSRAYLGIMILAASMIGVSFMKEWAGVLSLGLVVFISTSIAFILEAEDA